MQGESQKERMKNKEKEAKLLKRMQGERQKERDEKK